MIIGGNCGNVNFVLLALRIQMMDRRKSTDCDTPCLVGALIASSGGLELREAYPHLKQEISLGQEDMLID